jgi:Leucine-rich repeat (LRR) protein
LENIRELDVIHNRLERLPTHLGRLQHLTRLDLRYNHLSHLPTLRSMAQLKELQLGYNKLQQLGDLAAMLPPDLTLLDVRDNKIREIPASIAKLTALERLELSNNDISNLPPELGLLRKIKSIVLDGNPLRSLRRDIVRKGTQAVLEHLR